MGKYAVGAAGALLVVAVAAYLTGAMRPQAVPVAPRPAAPAAPLPGAISVPRDQLRYVSVGRDRRLALIDPAPNFPLQVPTAAALRVGFTIELSQLKRLRDLAVDFVATFEADGVAREVLRRRVDQTTATVWQEAELELGAFAGKRGVLHLRGEVAHGDLPLADLVVWTPPQLHRSTVDERPSFVLVSIDTLRADHLGCYGYQRDTSPVLDALAAQGTLFRNAIAPSTWTLPSHASLFTGLNPSRHGAVRYPSGTELDDRFTTVAERLLDAGYATAAYTDGGFVSVPFGFDQGFERFLYGPPRDDDTGDHLDERIHLASDWLEWTSGRPFFLFLHTYAVHSPYVPEPPYSAMFGLDGSPHRAEDTLVEQHRWRGRLGREPDLLEYIVALYDAEIRQTDAALGRLLALLDRAGLSERACVIVTSDHGEEFNEHGRLFHDRAAVFEELLRIPLIVRCPGGFAAGRAVEAPVSLIDVAPTILDLAGVSLAAGEMEGESLAATLRGGAEPESRTLLSETDGSMERLPGAVLSQRSGRYKLVTSTWDAGPRLYDLQSDQGERQDISAAHPDVVARLLAGLSADARNSLQAERPDARTDAPPTPDPAVLERLRALGYLQDEK